jgi:putative endonuclease
VTRQAAEKRGRGAETLACWHLRLRGWRILARRVRVRVGEVDIVARRGRTLAFVEVKARATAEAAAFSLDEWRLRRVAAAAEQLTPRFMRDGDNVRIDAIFVLPRQWPRHLVNVWARVTLVTATTRASNL